MQKLVIGALSLSAVALGPCSKDAGPSAAPSAATPATASAASNTADKAADPIVDLFHTVDCTVAVSSKVDNPKDFPEHLVDGKKETAWNGKTGDLAGFVLFRVPKSARVLRVELTAGFDKIAKDGGDLFTMNHRITKVRLSREGTVIKEADLDPNKRDLQAIDLDEPGDDSRSWPRCPAPRRTGGSSRCRSCACGVARTARPRTRRASPRRRSAASTASLRT
jgi:hypothetical protein